MCVCACTEKRAGRGDENAVDRQSEVKIFVARARGSLVLFA